MSNTIQTIEKVTQPPHGISKEFVCIGSDFKWKWWTPGLKKEPCHIYRPPQ